MTSPQSRWDDLRLWHPLPPPGATSLMLGHSNDCLTVARTFFDLPLLLSLFFALRFISPTDGASASSRSRRMRTSARVRNSLASFGATIPTCFFRSSASYRINLSRGEMCDAAVDTRRCDDVRSSSATWVQVSASVGVELYVLS